ncbi:MAG: hypothetical protein J5789_09230 [Oscillospiraceae bacterium]|nr:hypothetical protein [Oscillospiraceae bacterium]
MKHSRIAYTVSRKNPLVWIAVVLALASAVGFFLRLRFAEQGADNRLDFWIGVFFSVLPGLGAVYFAYQLAVNGKERLFRLSLPFWLLAAEAIFLAWAFMAWYYALLITAAALVLAWLTHSVLKGTIVPHWILFVPVGMFSIGFFLVFTMISLFAEELSLWDWVRFYAEVLLSASLLLLLFAIRKVEDGKYHPTWGDRFDGRKIRSLSPIAVVGTYIMPERNQANVFFPDKLEITALEKYVREKRAKGFEQFGMTEALLAAYVRTVSKYPGINRFISGEKIYTREDGMQFCMTVKKEMTKESPDTVIKVRLQPGDTVEEVYRKYHQTLNDAKKSMELDSSLDGVTALFGMIPGVVLKFVIWLLKFLDYFGLLPRFILEVSPFHGSIFFTSMGSLGIPAVYHHLYNFGNLPIFLAFGRKYRVNEVDDQGNTVSRKYLDYTFNVDERIVDGFYYATVIKYFHKLLLHPERLDEPDMEINRDIP